MNPQDIDNFKELVKVLTKSEFHSKLSMGIELINFINNFDRGRL